MKTLRGCMLLGAIAAVLAATTRAFAQTDPSPMPAPLRAERFVTAGSTVSPAISNELSPGNAGSGSFIVRAAAEFSLGGLAAVAGASVRSYQYPHTARHGAGACALGDPTCANVVGNAIYRTGLCPAPDPGCVTVVGFQALQAFNGLGQAYAPAFTAHETDADVHLGLKVFEPRVYAGIAYTRRTYDYLGYPAIGGAGFGVTKLPDLERPFSLHGSAWYYPSVSGTYTYPTSPFLGALSGSTATLSYSTWKYALGGTVALGKSGLFVDFGYDGQRASARAGAPSDTSLGAAYAGAGFRF